MADLKKHWQDPTKRPPSEATMKTESTFEAFTDLMRKVVKVDPRQEKQTISASPAPAAS